MQPVGANLLRRQLRQIRGRVHARRQHEDERRERRRVPVALVEIQHGGLHVLPPERVGHVRGRRLFHPVHSETSDEEHPLQLVALGLPLARKRRGARVLRLGVPVPVFPLPRVVLERLGDAYKVRHLLLELHHVVPRELRDPIRRRVRGLIRSVQHHTAAEEELPLVYVHLVVALKDPDAHLQRQEQLVRLEQTATGVLVHGVGVVRVEVFDSLLEHLRLWSLLDGQQEEILVRVQGELVHRIDRGEVVQDEVEDRRAYRHGSVERGRLGDFFAGCLCDFERLGHLVGRDLGVVQGVDELDVVEERAVRVGQQVEEGILELQDGPLALGNLAHERDALLVQVEPLLLDDDVEELILQPLLLDDKVDDCHLRGHLRSVVRVGQLRSEVQPEVRRVVHLLVPEFDAQRVALLDEALAQDGFQNRVNFFADVLDEDGIAKLDGVLHLANHVRHVQSHGDQTVGLLGVLDPLVPLALGVDQQRKAPRVGHNDAVLDRRRVLRQSTNRPGPDRDGVGERLLDVASFHMWD